MAIYPLIVTILCFLSGVASGNADIPPDLVEGEDYVTILNQSNSYKFMNYTPGQGASLSYSKFLIPVGSGKTANKILFQNYRAFPYHRDLIRAWPEFREFSASEIESITLSGEGRRFITGVLIVEGREEDHQGRTRWDIRYELISRDMLGPSQVRIFQDLLKESAPAIRRIKYYPSSQIRELTLSKEQEFLEHGIKLSVPQPSNQPEVYTKGWAHGSIHRVLLSQLPEQTASGQIRKDHILVMDKAPLNPPPVAGIITASPSSPWSHAALLMQSLGGVFLYEKGAMNNPRYRQLEESGQNIVLEAASHTRDRFRVLSELSDADERNVTTQKPGKKRIIQNSDRSDCRLLPLSRRHHTDKRVIGAKAANIAFMLSNPDNEVSLPDRPLALPFCFYERFLDSPLPERPSTTLRQEIASLSEQIEQTDHIRIRLALLATIRNLIQNTPVPEGMLRQIQQSITSTWPEAVNGLPIRLRSSSSVEDGKDFNGAGLYTSKTIRLTNSGELEKDLKKVWKSLYRDQAYQARQGFIIDESALSMAVLIHPSMKGELAKGVSVFRVTKDSQNRPVYIMELSGFPGEDLNVTNPPSGISPESTTVTGKADWNGNYQVSISKKIHSTEIPVGQNLLEVGEYLRLIGERDFLPY